MFFSQCWRLTYTEEELTAKINIIKKAEKVDNQNKIKGIDSLLKKNMNGYKSICNCNIFLFQEIENKSNKTLVNLLVKYSILFKLNIELNDNECLNYNLNYLNFSRRNFGFNDAAEFFFTKNLEKLNDEEITKLLIIANKPRYFLNENRVIELDSIFSMLPPVFYGKSK